MRILKRLSGGATLILVLLTSTLPLSAAGGWYLLVPPRIHYDEKAEFLNGYRILESTPLSQWAQQGAYDSLSECDAVRNSLLMVEQQIYTKSSEDYLNAVGTQKDLVALKAQRLLTVMNNVNVAALAASRCVKSDDQRLQEK